MGNEKLKNINELYIKYNNDLYNFIFLMIRDNEQAKDLMHDTFLQAYKKFDSFKDENVKSWLYKIARNLTIDYIRRRKPMSFFFDLTDVHSNIKGTEQIVTLNESEKELYLALAKLKRKYQQVIILRKIKEFTIKETSEILGCTEAKVKTNLLRGMKQLKKELEKEGYHHGI
ncbi:RNA polymerase sigma factor [Evansella sp. AB-rgal1]|uniref:RNA polymerase sigma factor n=1 Tax=Evansella sp. AB-rgal1 TaxID=3242696 RepID=UPI00359DBCDA